MRAAALEMETPTPTLMETPTPMGVVMRVVMGMGTGM
jgi:hypothetical protein